MMVKLFSRATALADARLMNIERGKSPVSPPPTYRAPIAPLLAVG
jgi:hypothetical protein